MNKKPKDSARKDGAAVDPIADFTWEPFEDGTGKAHDGEEPEKAHDIWAKDRLAEAEGKRQDGEGAGPCDGRYVPMPVPVDDVTLPKEVDALTEYIAENSHEEWAKLRMKEGWTFAPETDKALKQSKDLIPYCELLDSEKEYDRRMAMDTLGLLYKMGYRIVAPRNG